MKKNFKSLIQNIDWPVASFLVAIPLVATVWTPIYLYHYGMEFSLFLAFLISCIITPVSITAGYHRLFAHQSYQTSAWVRLIFLLVGAAAWQYSALKWATDHRRHHLRVDTDEDPYNAKRGFFYSHFGWLIYKNDPQYEGKYEADLSSDPLVAWQHKYYIPIAITMGFLVPLGIGWIMGRPMGGLLFLGFVRIAITQHVTYLINSAAHKFGSQPYTDKLTARDNTALAFLTFGEGYHNFHHRFWSDYRNGVRWYHWDPTKWLIQTMTIFGCAYSLKRTPTSRIVMARIQQDEKQLALKGVPVDRMHALKFKVEEAQKRLKQLRKDYFLLKEKVQANSRNHVLQVKAELRVAGLECKMAFRQWQAYRKTMWAL